jgi:hypothetical protein
MRRTLLVALPIVCSALLGLQTSGQSQTKASNEWIKVAGTPDCETWDETIDRNQCKPNDFQATTFSCWRYGRRCTWERTPTYVAREFYCKNVMRRAVSNSPTLVYFSETCAERVQRAGR